MKMTIMGHHFFNLLMMALAFLAGPALYANPYPVDAPRVAEDTAVETEIIMSPLLMSLLTTTDGTLAPVMAPREEMGEPPQWLVDWHASSSGLPKRLERVRWDDLSYEKQLLFLQHYAQYASFGRSGTGQRLIRGMRVRHVLSVRFFKPTIIFGKLYETGTHQIKTRGIFLPGVEYVSENSMDEVGLVELHVRSNFSAGNVLWSTMALMQALGFPPQSHHAHVVGSAATQMLSLSSKTDPWDRIAYIEYIRRLNLVAEFQSILEGNSIRVKYMSGQYDNEVAFQPFDEEDYEEFVKDIFVHGGRLRLLGPTSFHRIVSYVAPRTLRFYDKDDVTGIEHRAISEETEPESMAEFLDNVQQDSQNPKVGLSRLRLMLWSFLRRWDPTEKHAETTPLLDLYYNSQDFWANFKKMNLAFRLPSYLFWRKKQVDIAMSSHLELKMLVHDWSADPLLFDRPVLCSRIRLAQFRAGARIHRGENINSVMRDFLKQSGLARAFFESVRLSPRSCEAFLK